MELDKHYYIIYTCCYIYSLIYYHDKSSKKIMRKSKREDISGKCYKDNITRKINYSTRIRRS